MCAWRIFLAHSSHPSLKKRRPGEIYCYRVHADFRSAAFRRERSCCGRLPIDFSIAIRARNRHAIVGQRRSFRHQSVNDILQNLVGVALQRIAEPAATLGHELENISFIDRVKSIDA